jgi:hypothetical protein
MGLDSRPLQWLDIGLHLKPLQWIDMDLDAIPKNGKIWASIIDPYNVAR